MSAASFLFGSDPSVYCVSAYNENGRPEFVLDPSTSPPSLSPSARLEDRLLPLARLDDRAQAVARLEGPLAHRLLARLGPVAPRAPGSPVRLSGGLPRGDLRKLRSEQPAVGETGNCDVDSTGSSNRRSSSTIARSTSESGIWPI